MRKKLIAFLLMIISLFMLNSCGPSVPASEWGFENLSDMGNKMIKVLDYNVTGSGDDYVVINSNKITGYLFEDGNRSGISADIDETTGEIDMSELDCGTFDYEYEIVDNDNLNLNNGYTGMNIQDRITSEYRDNFVIFEMYTGGISGIDRSTKLIPYSLLDWNRGIDLETVEVEVTSGTALFKHTDIIEGYKLYLR